MGAERQNRRRAACGVAQKPDDQKSSGIRPRPCASDSIACTGRRHARMAQRPFPGCSHVADSIFPRGDFRSPRRFLCNPVDGETHFNPRTQKDSRRSEESVTSFRYAVLECDQEPKEKWFPIWLKILAGLLLPIVAITDSAGKSAHALVRGSCHSKQDWDRFKHDKLRPLVALGADDGALSAVRLTRLPGCFRSDYRQELLYLNPSATGTPIIDMQ